MNSKLGYMDIAGLFTVKPVEPAKPECEEGSHELKFSCGTQRDGMSYRLYRCVKCNKFINTEPLPLKMVEPVEPAPGCKEGSHKLKPCGGKPGLDGTLSILYKCTECNKFTSKKFDRPITN